MLIDRDSSGNGRETVVKHDGGGFCRDGAPADTHKRRYRRMSPREALDETAEGPKMGLDSALATRQNVFDLFWNSCRWGGAKRRCKAIFFGSTLTGPSPGKQCPRGNHTAQEQRDLQRGTVIWYGGRLQPICLL